MTTTWAVRYRDRNGEVDSAILNDGERLSLTLRGVEFRGTMLDDFAPAGAADPARLATFTLNAGHLCACTLGIRIPVPVASPSGTESQVLEATLTLGSPAPGGALDRENLKLAITIGGKRYESPGLTGWFEDEMLELGDRLPEGTRLKACITCAWSDYSPAGMGLFGGLACFRGNKSGYAKVDTKADLMDIWNTLTGFVQETWLCPEYEPRKPETGYRG